EGLSPMSGRLGDDRRRTASVLVPPARNHDRARIGGTCSPRSSGTRPGTPCRPLRWRTEAETGEESWERTDEALRDTAPGGLLKQPDEHKGASPFEVDVPQRVLKRSPVRQGLRNFSLCEARGHRQVAVDLLDRGFNKWMTRKFSNCLSRFLPTF